MFPLFETIKIDRGVPLRLEWHQRRMDYAFHVLLGSNNPLQLKELLKVPDTFGEGLVKCRFLYSREDFEIQFLAHTPRQVTSLKLVYCDTIDYSHKYSNRSMLEDLSGQKGEADDILIVRDGLITDTSFSNIVFFDGASWLTPEEPLLEGTARNRLIAEGKISAARIRMEDLIQFQAFRLINAMIEFEMEEDRSTKYII